MGLGLEVELDPVVTAVDVPSYVQTFFGGKAGIEAPPAPGLSARGDLTGPGIDEPITLTAVPGQKFAIPALHEKGEYLLQNVRLVGASGEFLQQAVPAVATIQVTDVLQTKVKVRQLTPDELRERGILIGERNYEVYGHLWKWRTCDAELVYEECDLEGRPRRTRQIRYRDHSGFGAKTVRGEYTQQHEWNVHGERKASTMPANGTLPAQWTSRVEESHDDEGNVATVVRGLGGASAATPLMTAEYRNAARPSVRTVQTSSAASIVRRYGYEAGSRISPSARKGASWPARNRSTRGCR